MAKALGGPPARVGKILLLKMKHVFVTRERNQDGMLLGVSALVASFVSAADRIPRNSLYPESLMATSVRDSGR